MNCPKCGIPLQPGITICPACRTPIAGTGYSPRDQRRQEPWMNGQPPQRMQAGVTQTRAPGNIPPQNNMRGSMPPQAPMPGVRPPMPRRPEKQRSGTALIVILSVMIGLIIVVGAVVALLLTNAFHLPDKAEDTVSVVVENIADNADTAAGAGANAEADAADTEAETTPSAQDTVAAAAADPMDALKDISASSYLEEPDYDLIHNAALIFDNDLSTAWVEGADGSGVGESITFTFDGKQTLRGFTIRSGYQKGDDLYDKNNRPSQLRLTFSDGTELTFDIADTTAEQTFTFDTPVSADSVTFTIAAVYAGSTYTDTCISELALF